MRMKGECEEMKDTNMRIQIDEDIYTGSAVEIMEQLRQQLFDTGDFPDVETYIWYLRQNYERITGLRAMFYSLAEIGALQLLEEAEND